MDTLQGFGDLAVEPDPVTLKDGIIDSVFYQRVPEDV
jgi:hypothetical protein